LIGKTRPSNAWAAILVAVAALFASSWFWRYGLRKYSGASG